MTSPQGALARLAPLVFAAVVLQVSAVAQVRLLGGGFDLLPLLVAAVALYAGSIPGAATGFSAGLLLELAVGRELGLSSLVLTAVGYAVGRYRDERDPSHALIPIPLGAAATAGYAVGLALVNFLLEIEAYVSGLDVVAELLVTALLNGLLAPLVFVLVRRVLRPVLLASPSDRRTRRGPREPELGLRGLGG